MLWLALMWGVNELVCRTFTLQSRYLGDSYRELRRENAIGTANTTAANISAVHVQIRFLLKSGNHGYVALDKQIVSHYLLNFYCYDVLPPSLPPDWDNI